MSVIFTAAIYGYRPGDKYTGPLEQQFIDQGIAYADIRVALVDLGVGPSSSRLLRAAAKGISPIKGLMGVAPTYSQGATNANSTIIAGSTTALNGGQFEPNDATKVIPLSGPIALDSTPTRYRLQSAVNTLTPLLYIGAKGHGVAFKTFASAFDIAMQTAGTAVCLYVTDLTTGIRARAQAADQTTASGNSYHKWDFGSRGLRQIEVYQKAANAGTFNSINVGTNDNIWPATFTDQSRIAFLWDSWGSDGGSSNTNPLKLTVTDFIGERLGVANPQNYSVGSTGLLLGSNVATSGTFRQRIAIGAIDASRIGNLDLLILPGSLNDQAATDAACQAEYTLTIQAAMIAQPNAIIVGFGPQFTPGALATQTRYDAHKAGFAAAAGSHTRMIYLDNSPAGENWLFAGINATVIGADGFHPNDVGMPYVGYRIADSILNAIKNRFQV